MKKRLQATFLDLVALDSVSGKENEVAEYVVRRFTRLGLNVTKDKKGNVIGFLAGKGEPLLLNAHLDRVSPGKGHTPIIEGDIIKSDGTTNLGADDAAGVTVILEALETVVKEKRDHPPVVVAFTVQEEIGLWGAKALDVSKYRVKRGIVYDNAFEKAGVVVSRGAAYVAFDVEIKGKSVHPGKNLADGINIVNVFRKVDLPIGETDDGQTRINIGTMQAGDARNKVPDTLKIQGEIRSFLDKSKLERRIKKVEQAFTQAAEEFGATVSFTPKQLAVTYSVDKNEPLLQAYKNVIASRGGTFTMQKTFIASDGNALRGEKGLKVFVVSTGVTGEHSISETVRLSDLVLLTNDLIALLENLGSSMTST